MCTCKRAALGEREHALERLARELSWIEQRLDPDVNGEWSEFDERERGFYRDCIEWLLTQRPDLQIAMSSPTTSTIGKL